MMLLPWATATVTATSPFVWPDQWSAIQEVHMTSGNFTGAFQVGKMVYDYTNLRTREDQALISGPPLPTWPTIGACWVPR